MAKSVKTLCSVALLVFSVGSFADEGQGDRPRPGHKPPQEAIDACSGKNDGDACSFTGRRDNNVEGFCRRGPSQEHELVCVPRNHRHAHPLDSGKGDNGSEQFRNDDAGGNTGERSGGRGR